MGLTTLAFYIKTKLSCCLVLGSTNTFTVIIVSSSIETGQLLRYVSSLLCSLWSPPGLCSPSELRWKYWSKFFCGNFPIFSHVLRGFDNIKRFAFTGDVLRWEQQIQFRHMTTGLYLCVNRDEVVCLRSNSSDPDTVFTLYNLVKVRYFLKFLFHFNLFIFIQPLSFDVYYYVAALGPDVFAD